MREIRLDTLGDFHNALSITAYCDICPRSRELDIPMLIRRYGPTLTIAALKARLTCRQCRRRSRSIRISHDGRPG